MKGSKFHVDENGCHIWDRAKNNRGYGVVWYLGKVRLAHRVAWHERYGAWPAADMVIDHQCNTKACVNVGHLRELSNSQNLRRAYPRGDAETERRRARWRAANARRRGNYRYTEEGEENTLVQD
jgi:hypothetical protein